MSNLRDIKHLPGLRRATGTDSPRRIRTGMPNSS